MVAFDNFEEKNMSDESYQSLLKIIKPIPNLDEEKELNEYRMKKYKLKEA